MRLAPARGDGSEFAGDVRVSDASDPKDEPSAAGRCRYACCTDSVADCTDGGAECGLNWAGADAAPADCADCGLKTGAKTVGADCADCGGADCGLAAEADTASAELLVSSELPVTKRAELMACASAVAGDKMCPSGPTTYAA